MPIEPLVLRNARIFDGHSADCAEGMSVVVAEGRVQEITSRAVKAPRGARTFDVGGRTLMPGLIDAHTHAYACDVNVHKIETVGPASRTAHAVRMLGFALDCGFTTVRDICGGDRSLAKAIDDGLIRSPRYLYAGKALSMTGGHGDMREIDETPQYHAMCACGIFNSFAKVADGVTEVIRATREELRQGAHCIKIMGSGGVASPTDPLWMNQYREDEIRAIVQECSERRTYASAHCHPASAARRCAEFGVRCIEHGTLMDDETARFIAKKGAYVVPTLSILHALVEEGPRLGFPAQMQAKAQEVAKGAIEGLHVMRKAKVKLGYGTDLLGSLYVQQCREFTLRREVFSPLELLRQATSINAEMMMLEDTIGCVKPGAHADLIVVDGDPLKDIGLLAQDGRKLTAIVRGGAVVKG
jgi:imidazolonepropionase-like amidohydrolase